MQASSDILTLPKDGRTFLVGRTGSGKSYLENLLMWNYLAAWPSAKILVLDTSTNYRAEWLLSGFSAARHYKKIDQDKTTFLPGAYLFDVHVGAEGLGRHLDLLFRESSIVLAQSEHEEDWPTLKAAARTFYERYSAREPRLLVIDELADFYRAGTSSDIFWRTARAGRKHNVALLAGSQRPRFIPTPVLTEADRYYMFYLDNRDDMKKMWDLGIPKEKVAPVVDYSFLYWNKKERDSGASGKYYIVKEQ
jgi:hypothetical protein